MLPLTILLYRCYPTKILSWFLNNGKNATHLLFCADILFFSYEQQQQQHDYIIVFSSLFMLRLMKYIFAFCIDAFDLVIKWFWHGRRKLLFKCMQIMLWIFSPLQAKKKFPLNLNELADDWYKGRIADSLKWIQVIGNVSIVWLNWARICLVYYNFVSCTLTAIELNINWNWLEKFACKYCTKSEQI